MITKKRYHMKPIYIVGWCVLISISSFAQQNEKNKVKEKDKAGIAANEKTDRKIKDHERVVWAGTGIDLNEKSKNVKNVPNAVLTSFRQYFPNQEIDNFRKYRGLIAVTTSNPVYTTTLVYKPNGAFVEARTVATESDLPASIKENITRKAGYTSDGLVMIENANKEKFYRVHLKKGQENEFVFYNAAGEQVLYDY
jgi:hypothetical protein